MIKIEMKPTQYQIEIPDYGVFDVSPLGAGAEAEIRCLFRELDEAMENTKKPEFKALADREKAGEEIDKESQDYKDFIEAYKKGSEVIEKLRETVMEKMRNVIKGKNVDKLFNDFTYEQILEIHKKATREND